MLLYYGSKLRCLESLFLSLPLRSSPLISKERFSPSCITERGDVIDVFPGFSLVGRSENGTVLVFPEFRVLTGSTNPPLKSPTVLLMCHN